MIDGGNNACGEIVLMSQRTIECNAQGFLRDPAFAQLMDIVQIICGIILGQHDSPVDDINELPEVRISFKK